MSAEFPAYDSNNNPPVITLTQYDEAPWASKTCVDFNRKLDKYVAVEVDKHDHIVAVFEDAARQVLDTIFKSAKSNFYEK